MKSQRSKSKTKRHSKSKARFDTEEDFFHNIMDINIKKPGSSFNYYIKDMMQKHDISKLGEAASTYKSKWDKLSDKDKEKYEEQRDEEEKRYIEHLAAVKKYLVDVDQLKDEVSPYMMFKRAYVSHAINKQDREPKEARDSAKGEWENMSKSERKKWEDEFDKNKALQEELRNFRPGKVHAYTLFIKDKVQDGLNFTEASNKWKDISDKQLAKYEKYAEEENKEKRKKLILWQISTGIKPKKPVGAFRFFYNELKADGKLKNLKNQLVEASEMYKKLSDEEKEKYEKLHKQESLEYQIKMAEYKKFISNRFGNAPTAVNLYYSDKAKDFEDEEDLEPGELFKLIAKKWKEEKPKVKEEYEKRAEELKKEYDDYKKSRLDVKKPKMPKSAYTVYQAENFAHFAKKHPNKPAKEIFKEVAKQWNETTDKEREPYEKKAEKDRARYEREIEEFEQENDIRGRTKNTQRFFDDGRRSKNNSKSAYSQNMDTQSAKEASQRRRESQSKKKKNRTRSKRKDEDDDDDDDDEDDRKSRRSGRSRGSVRSEKSSKSSKSKKNKKDDKKEKNTKSKEKDSKSNKKDKRRNSKSSQRSKR